MVCAHGSRSTEVDRILAGGGATLLLRAAPRPWRSLVEGARGHGFSEVVLASAALDLEGAASEVSGAGFDAVRAIVFSHVPRVHDTLTGREGSLAGALFAMRAIRRVPITIEAPVLPLRLSDPRKLVELGLRAGVVRGFRFYAPSGPVPEALGPPRWTDVAPALEEAARMAEAGGAELLFEPSQRVPLCAFGDEPAMHARFRFRRARGNKGEPVVDACGRCAHRGECAGPTENYAARHGGAGLRPFEARARTLTGEAKRRPRYGAEERRAAKDVQFLVFRPTVHCNQDCLFCSANESSNNAFADEREMLRAIARAGSRGVRRISFSGGEPTLVPALPEYVRAAHRCGIAEIEIVTNAVLLAREGRAARLREAGLTHAFVSLHAHDEALSRALTQKEGDHARTREGIRRLLDEGVLTAVNHVITTRNQGYLTAFVERLHAEFDGRVFLSFAFVTPQYKALEHPELVPRLSEATVHLRRAMRRAIELGQPFVVGSRQGVPPCFLGPFAAWSDIFGIVAEAVSEDAPQKVRGPACERCRYRAVCHGLWRPYAERHGFAELTPVIGDPWSDDELTRIRALHRRPPWGVPMAFEDAPPLLRDHDAETRPDPAPPKIVSLPVVPARTRPLRALLVGSGRRAEELARHAEEVPELAWVGIASPHAPDARGGWWGALPTFRSAERAIEELAPEAIVIAASSDAHEELARLAAAAEIPTLIEKPLAPTAARAAALADELAGRKLSCALQELFLPGIAELLDAPGEIEIHVRARPRAPDSPRAWGYAPLFETLQHALVIPVVCRGPLERTIAVDFAGASRPERISLRFATARGEHAVRFDFTATEDALAVRVGERRYLRDASGASIDGAMVGARRSETARMLAAFVRAVLDGAEMPVPLARGAHVVESAERALAAFVDAGAPLTRPTAPKHVASPRYREARGARK
ncbi:MAG: radical SAM protein [Sandaracinaceae bacterium]